jgi:hypothetical protein
VAGIDVALPGDTGAPPLPESVEAVVEAEAADAPAESVADADADPVTDAGATDETPLTLTAPPAAPVAEAPVESVDDDPVVSVDDDPVVSVEDEEPPSVPLLPPVLPLLPLLFTAPIVKVQVLTSWTAALPLLSVIGVSVMIHVCVISPAGVEVVDWVITVLAWPSDWRLMTIGTAFAGESARNRQWKRKRKARWFGRRDNMAGELEKGSLNET